MSEPLTRRVGLSPGTLLHIGERHLDTARLELFSYTPEQLEHRADLAVEACLEACQQPGNHWANLTGIHDVALVERLGSAAGLDSLALEDILNTEHRPKVEVFDELLLVILKMLAYDREGDNLVSEQVSIVLGQNKVVTFQERPWDLFDGVRDRLQTTRGRMRHRGPDYLAYALIDAVVDGYFVVLEELSERLTDLEEELAGRPQRTTLQRIHQFKRELIVLRKAVWPLREVVAGLERDGGELIDERTAPFLRDLYDHVIQVIETVETLRDTVSGLLDLYLSSVSQRTNEIMKVLTVMATIFIPLTFIAGVYGMNFHYMPELQWRWGYPALWLFMITCAVGMLMAFRRKNWL
jgi:magnesium transporter